MTNKKIIIIKLELKPRKATPAPPVGPVLGQYGINIMKFCKEYNDLTRDKVDLIIPVKIFIYHNHQFSLMLKKAPTAVLLNQALNSSLKIHHKKILSLSQIELIAKEKISDLNTDKLHKAIKIICGTAKSMNIPIVS
uniref:Large ribosomal subunit protein uL11c n=1 Tax=Pterocladiophila hemisphaerica TaxID=2712948 RepID=A0A6M3WWU0_9FLOR|nr:ribosomal protein L11 [Pterocladiophila hemisphaerica]